MDRPRPIAKYVCGDVGKMSDNQVSTSCGRSNTAP